MKQNKILFLTLYTFSLTGGIEKVCRSLAKALTDLGVQFQLYALHDFKADLDQRYLGSNQYKAFNGRKFNFALATVVKGITSKTIILSHVNLLIFAWIVKKLVPRTRIILYAHGIEIWGRLPNWKKKFLQKKVEIWAVSEFTAAKISTIHQVNSKNITILPNCLDPYFNIPKEFERPTPLLNRYRLQQKQPILFTLTRLSNQEAYKGYDQVLSAMPALIQKFPNLYYLLAGKADDEEYQRVNVLIEQLGLTNHVSLCGFIKEEELSDHFKLASLFIMPSTQEGFGIVFIEATACGAKVIGGNVDGSADALLKGRLGTLIDPVNIEEIQLAIENNLSKDMDPVQIQKLSLANFAYPDYLLKIKSLMTSNTTKAV